MADIGGIERGGLGRHAARKVGIADDRHPIVGDDLLVHDGQLAIAALFGGKIDDHRARLHALDHVAGPQLRRLAAGDQRGGDDDVHVGGELAELGELSVPEFRARHRGVTARFRAVLGFLGEIEIDEFGAHALDLLGDFRAHVEGVGDRAEGCGGADGRKTRDARAHDEDLRRRHLAGRRDLSGEEAAEIAARLDHRPVAGDIGHGGQGIHLLGARDARHHVHGDDGRAPIPCRFHRGLVLAGIEEGDQRLALGELRDFLAQRRAHLHDDVGLAIERCGIVDDGHPGFAIGLVRKARLLAGAGLDQAVMAELLQLLRRGRRHRDARLSFVNFLRCPDLHLHPPLEPVELSYL